MLQIELLLTKYLHAWKIFFYLFVNYNEPSVLFWSHIKMWDWINNLITKLQILLQPKASTSLKNLSWHSTVIEFPHSFLDSLFFFFDKVRIFFQLLKKSSYKKKCPLSLFCLGIKDESYKEHCIVTKHIFF